MPSSPMCFVIMPFGGKTDVNGKITDFDEIFDCIIQKPVEELGLECVRCDKIAQAGVIHEQMFRHIYEADVAVVDITSLNANVFYELGVRHALVDSVTVLLRRKGTNLPFNIQDLKVIEYDPEHPKSVDSAKDKIKEFITNGLKLRQKDSPVHGVLNLKIGTAAKPLTKSETINYLMKNVPGKTIGIKTGDIREVKDIDVWVNSENTNMQMARHYDRSVSSVIRYRGAVRNKAGQVTNDVIAKELAEAVGDNANVPAGEVVVTGSGELQKTNGVKKIFHAAAVAGQVGIGYCPIPEIGVCVRNALSKADEDEQKDVELKSMLIPLMGTGTARGDLEQKAKELINAAICHLEAHPECRIDRVYFLTWSEKELEACQGVLDSSDSLVPEQKMAAPSH